MPRRFDDVTLRITWKPDKMAERTIDLGDWPGAVELRRQVAVGLTAKVAEGGTWHSGTEVGLALPRVRRFVSWCEESGIDSLEAVTPSHFDAFEATVREAQTETSAHNTLSSVRLVLQDSPGLPTHTGWRVSERMVGPAPRGTQPHYTLAEVKALQAAATRATAKARLRVQRNHRLASAHIATKDTNERHLALMQLLDGTGELTPHHRRLLGPPEPVTARRNVSTLNHFLLTSDEALAAAVLLVCREGFNLSPLDWMSTGDESATLGDEDTIFTVNVDKARRQTRRHSTSTMADGSSAAAARAWAMVEDATAPARQFLAARGVETDRLFIYRTMDTTFEDPDRSPLPGIRYGVPSDKHTRRKAAWIPPGLEVHFPKLRRTVQTLVNRSPTQNTRASHIRDYLLLSDEVVDELNQEAAAAMESVVGRAERRLVLRLADEYQVAPDIADGSKDTATVACKDIFHHPVTGQLCTDNFLMCLMCENAVATVRHLPRLVLIHQALEDLRSTLTERAWARWHDDYLRLTAFLHERVRLDEDSYREHLAAATQRDREEVARLLGGVYDAT